METINTSTTCHYVTELCHHKMLCKTDVRLRQHCSVIEAHVTPTSCFSRHPKGMHLQGWAWVYHSHASLFLTKTNIFDSPASTALHSLLCRKAENDVGRGGVGYASATAVVARLHTHVRFALHSHHCAGNRAFKDTILRLCIGTHHL